MKTISSSHQGYVLLITLVFLVVLTVLSLASVSLNTTQSRIAANATDSEIAFEKAEGALNQATNLLLNGTYPVSNFAQNANGFYTLDPNVLSQWAGTTWPSSSSVVSSFQGNTGNAASYLIERLPSVLRPGQNMQMPTFIYRITARAPGGTNNTAVILQTTVQFQ